MWEFAVILLLLHRKTNLKHVKIKQENKNAFLCIYRFYWISKNRLFHFFLFKSKKRPIISAQMFPLQKNLMFWINLRCHILYILYILCFRSCSSHFATRWRPVLSHCNVDDVILSSCCLRSDWLSFCVYYGSNGFMAFIFPQRRCRSRDWLCELWLVDGLIHLQRHWYLIFDTFIIS